MEEGQAVAADPQDRIAAILGNEREPEQAPEAQPEAEAPQAQEAEPVAEETAQEEAPEEPQDDASPLEWDSIKNAEIEITVQGEKSKVSLEEARLGYMRTADYQRKTQEVAAQRREAVEQARQAITTAQEQYAKQLNALQTNLQRLAFSEFQGVDLNQLAATNPAEYVRLQHKLTQYQQTQAQIAQELQRAEQAKEQESQQSRAEALEQARQDLLLRIPDFSESVRNNVVKTGKELGFSDDELGKLTDPKIVHALHLASQFLNLQASKPLVNKKVADAPKVMKPGAKQVNTSAKQSEELKQRIRKSAGKDEDALRAFIAKTLK